MSFGLVLAACVLPASGETEKELPDPVPLRRVLIAPDRVAQEMKRVQEGALVRLPRAEFEALVRRAAREKERAAPRLAEARYRAALQDPGDGGSPPCLVGTGQWKVIYGGSEPGLLDLGPGPQQTFNLALKQPRFENRNALVADFDGRNLALLVDRPGEQSVALEWSARGQARPEGLRFDLNVPPSPAASLELDVPAGREVSALDGSLISGPHPAERADRRLWKVGCGGGSRVRLLVRPPDAPGSGREPLLLVTGKTVQRLHPEGLDATFDFTLELLHQGVRELVFLCDPALRPREVTAPNLEAWTFQPGAAPGGPARLTVRLREPLREGTVQVSCLAPLAAGPGQGPVEWTSPGMRLERAVPRGETLELYLHPDLRVESWDPGGFRLTDTRVSAEGPVRWQRLTLTGGGVAPEGAKPGTPPRRPGARLHARGPEFRARQLAWWQVGADGMALTLQIEYEVSHGRLFQLPVLLPGDWQIEGVDVNPPRLLHTWGVRPGSKTSQLLVDLQRPLTAAGTGRTGGVRPRDDSETPAEGGASATLTVRLHSGGPGPVTGRPLPFPDAVPLGARFREGALAIGYDEQVNQAALDTRAVRAEAAEDGPWGKQLPECYYPYRGKPVEGKLVLTPRPPRLRAKCTSDVVVNSGQAAVETRLLLEAEAGSPDTVELYLSAGGGGPWEWHTEQGERPFRRAERLHAAEVAGPPPPAGPANPPGAVVPSAARPHGERWRLTLARPLRVREPLVIRATRKLEPAGGRWDVPLPAVLGASRLEGEVSLRLAGADLVGVETTGLREVTARGGAEAAWRTFRYSQPPVGLTLRGGAPASAGGHAGGERTPPHSAAVEQARLTSYVGTGGVVQHHFVFRVRHWPQRTLPVRLPPGSRPLAAQVDGHWLAGLVPSGEGPDVLRLPVPDRGEGPGGPHRYEVVYAGTLPAWSVWTELETVAPDLPVAPTEFRRSWRLPPGVRPLPDGRLRRLPGAGEGGGPAEGRRRPGDLLRLSGPLARPWADRPGTAEQRQALAEAAVSLRTARAGQSLSLEDLVAQVAFNYLKGQHPLVVDTAALREAGVGPGTVLAVKPPASQADRALPWEGRGLVALCAPPATLLTTRRQCDLWHVPADPDSAPALSASLLAALAEAAGRGQDASGRFRSALEWRQAGEGKGGDAAGGGRSLLPLDAALGPWTEWEPVAGAGGDGRLVLVRRDAVTAAGLALAAALVLAFWRLGGARRRLGLLLAWLALAGLGLLWLPAALQDLAWWPLLAGSALALLGYLRWAARGVARPAGSARLAKGVAAAGVLAALAGVGPFRSLSGPPAAAPQPAPVTVFVLPGPADAPDRQAVLAPPELIDRLRRLARPAEAGRPGAVLLAAKYEGKVEGVAADFEAVFEAYGLSDGPSTLTLPLGDVQLQGGVWLDGARAHPVALPAPRVGYALPVQGRGRHKVELHFRVPQRGLGNEVVPQAPPAGPAEDRGVEFSVPRLVQNRLALTVPGGATYLQALVTHGAQKVSAVSGGSRLEVELGPVTAPVRLRWSQGGGTRGPTRVEFQEAYLWDLHDDASSLTALLHYRIARGPVSALRVDLPAGLEVRAAEARRPAGKGRAADAVRLRDWRVTGSGKSRSLRLEFATPVSGECQVRLDLVPRAALAARVTLPLPTPHGRQRAEGGYLAYRVRGLRAHRENWLRVRPISGAAFAPFWPASSRPDPRSLAYAGAFRREGSGQGPVLQLHLEAPAGSVEVRQSVTLRVGPRQADVTATAELTAPQNDLSLVVWDLQSPLPLTVAAVSGPGVRRWSQSGGRVLVWLEATAGSARLELTGWLPLSPAGGDFRLDVPCLRVASARKQVTWLRVVAGGDLALGPMTRHGLLPLPAARASAQERDYVSDQPVYGGSCRVRPGGGAAVRVLTFAEVRDRRLQFTATVDYLAPRGDLRAVQVRLRNWEGEVHLAARGEVRRWERRRRPDDRVWTVGLRPGAVGPYRLTLTGSLPAEEAAAGVPMPDVSVPGLGGERWLAVAGGDLSAEAVAGLAPAPRARSALQAWWPREAERVGRTKGSAWRVRAADWSLRLAVRDRPAAAGALRVFLGEKSAAVVDGRRWLHQAVYWLRHEAHTDLRVTLPGPAEVVSVSVDGAEVLPLQPDPRRLWLPLPGRAGVRCVRLRYLYESEDLARPELGRPQLDGVREGPTVWTVYVPGGWGASETAGARGLGRGAARAASLALYRAEAQLRISRALADQGREAESGEALAAAQRRFARACRQAEHAVEVGAGRDLAAWLQELQKQNRELAHRHAFEPVRAAAERQARGAEAVQEEEVTTPAEGPGRGGGAFPERGVPLSWQAGAGEPAPRVELVSREARRTRAALAASGPWLGLLAAVWALSLSPVLLARLRVFWPEPITLLGAFGWYLAGPTILVVLLLMLGVCGRLTQLGQGVRSLIRRRAPAPGSGSGGNSSGT